ncbi:MAG TPA: pyridoxal-phosphate dependent enzyme [Tepidisphaeraceae bacterium]|jgi:cysteine synthase|nr:pyridoxal-phosphate dependent enzyme [Tepidisphaeraceae bacterium]
MDIALEPHCDTMLDTGRLAELSDALNPFRADRVRIVAQTCGDNIKKFAALNLLLEAKAAGRLEGVHTLVENSSGNMALALGLLAPQFGIRKVIAILRADVPSGKLDPLRLSRIQCQFSTELPGEPGGIELAKQIGGKGGYCNLGQYENDANPRAYEMWLGPRIWKMTQGRVSLICCGLGSTGTAVGLKRFVLRTSPRCTVVGVMVAPGEGVPGVRTEARLSEIRFPWRQTLDAVETVGTRESFKKSRELWWELNLMVGPSSGFALAGLLKFLAARKAAGELDRLRNDDGEILAVFVCPDLAYPYFDKYSTHLDPQDMV